MENMQRLNEDYPWIQTPLVVGAPMRLIALADMAVEISKAGGIGFIGAGTDVSDLDSHLRQAKKLLQESSMETTSNGTLPIGVGFINWGADLAASVALIKEYCPAAVWFFAPSSTASLVEWATESRNASPNTKIWVQVGSVGQAMDVVVLDHRVKPDVLVVQGTDAGGHGLAQGAGLISLLPEVCDTMTHHFDGKNNGNGSGSRGEVMVAPPVILAAGGIVEARGATAALVLGASGVVLGTRFLASHEANISRGYQDEVLRACDGGQTTVRTKVYDTLRGTNWAESHNARGLCNRSYVDAMRGMDEEENRRLYAEEVKKGDQGWGVEGRMTTYAGSAVGLIHKVKSARDIVEEVRQGIIHVLPGVQARL